MKKIILPAILTTLALSSPAFAVLTDYNGDVRSSDGTYSTSTNSTDTGPNSLMPSAGNTTANTSTAKHHHHHKKSQTSSSSARHPNAGDVPTHSEDMNDNATSRQGEPSGETNGPVNGQSDDQNYGSPTNH